MAISHSSDLRSHRFARLQMLLTWIVVGLILKVLVTILANYGDYFPANFKAEFLVGREPIFHGLYRVAFYTHILSTPVVLIQGLLLLNGKLRRRFLKLHRWMGRVQVVMILGLVVPSSWVMANYSLAGTISNYGFMASTVLVGVCTAMGWRYAMLRRIDLHRMWMLRCYVLLCSAVTLRLIGGMTEICGWDSLISYRIASWVSWLLPLLCLEIAQAMRTRPKRDSERTQRSFFGSNLSDER